MKVKGAGPEILDRRFYPAGTKIIEEGDVGSCAYMVQSGQVKVYQIADEREFVLANLGEGEIFGEMALVIDEPRSANVVTLKDSTIVVISRDNLLLKLASTDATIKKVLEMLMRRLVQTNAALMKRCDAIDEIVEVCYSIYKNAYQIATPKKQISLEKNILPKLTDFMEAVREHLKGSDNANTEGDILIWDDDDDN